MPNGIPVETSILIAESHKGEFALKEASNVYRWLKDFTLPDTLHTVQLWYTRASVNELRVLESDHIYYKWFEKDVT